jgi:hypothetical protein
MKSARKKAVDFADKWFSLYIREDSQLEYGGCAFCGKPIQHCFHFFSRVAYSTRWDENNAIGSCAGCNFKMEHHPYEFYKWFIDHFGQFALDNLNRKWHTINKLSTQDILDTGERFKKAYETLKGIN